MTYCKKCDTEKGASDFYAGVPSRCKECHKAAIRHNRAENADYYREYDKMRFQRDEHRRLDNKARAQTEKGRAIAGASRKKWLAQNPEKRAAHVILGNAVRDGRVYKPKSCSRCNSVPPRRWLHAHHHDYAKPLDVEWICINCHADEHYPNEYKL